MTNFNFSDDESLEINRNKIVNIDIQKSKNNITNIIKNYLSFINKKKLVPELPSNIEIKYVSEDIFSKIVFKISKNKQYEYPSDYSYPASMSPETSTLYISTDFNKKNKAISKIKKGIETNDIVLFRGYVNQDNQKALEYTFGHELGHFFLLSKNHKNPELDENNFIQRIARNIEEGFSEAFSIQLMCLKDPNLNFSSIKNGRNYDSDLRLKNKTDKSVLPEQRFNYFQKVGFEKLIDSYDFKTIYDNLPIKDINGNIEQDIEKIYETCLKIAKDNNKQVINDIINNETFINDKLINNFSNGLKTCIKEPNINNLNTQELIDKIHSKITGTSFNTDKIKMFREKFLNINNDSNHKPK